MANENNEAADAQVIKPVSEDDKTAKIPRPGGAPNDGKVVLKSGADSVIKPSDATRIAPAIPQPGENAKSPASPAKPPSPAKPISPQTIKLKPVSDTASEDVDAGETVSVDRDDVVANATPKVAKKNDAAPLPAKPAKSKTIKLKPLKPNAAPEDDQELGETLSLSRDSLPDIPAGALGGTTTPPEDDEATIKIQKPTTTKPSHPVPPASIPGAKETIKLRPSNNTPPPPPSAPTVNLSPEEAGDVATPPSSDGKRTIRLVPKSSTDDDATQRTPKPSDPTVNLKEVAETPVPAPAQPTPSAQTVKMDTPPEAPKRASAKRTLKLKPTGRPTKTDIPKAVGSTGTVDVDNSDSAVDDAPSFEDAASDSGGEPNIIFTLVAVISLGLLAYYAYLAGTQWMALNG